MTDDTSQHGVFSRRHGFAQPAKPKPITIREAAPDELIKAIVNLSFRVGIKRNTLLQIVDAMYIKPWKPPDNPAVDRNIVQEMKCWEWVGVCDYDGDCFVDCQMFFDFKKKPAASKLGLGVEDVALDISCPRESRRP